MGSASIIKKSVLDNFNLTESIPFETALMTIGIAFIVGIFIYFIYKKTFTGVIFPKSFGPSLIMLSMVTSLVIMVISSNLMLSLGMVGALSIVRFRTAVKDTLDTIFMFWAIAEGIVIGAQLYTIALIGMVGIGVLMFVVSLFGFKRTMPYILVLRFDETSKKEVNSMLSNFPRGKLKNKTVSRGTIELTIEMRIGDQEIAMVDAFAKIPGVYDASIVSYNGDVIA